MADDVAEDRIDKALVARVLLTSDQRAFEQLVRRHQGKIRAQLRRLLRNDDAWADDLAQETFLRAWRKLDQFRYDARFSTWLYRIAHCCFVDAVRKRPQATHFADDAELDQLAAPRRSVDFQIDLERALQHLTEVEQTVLIHCVQLGLSHEETAYVLAMPLGTVKTHANRGKVKLRACLAEWDEANNKETQ